MLYKQLNGTTVKSAGDGGAWISGSLDAAAGWRRSGIAIVSATPAGQAFVAAWQSLRTRSAARPLRPGKDRHDLHIVGAGDQAYQLQTQQQALVANRQMDDRRRFYRAGPGRRERGA